MELSKNKLQKTQILGLNAEWGLILTLKYMVIITQKYTKGRFSRLIKMKYIVNSKEVSRDTFYFCKRAKEENKRFVLLNPNNDLRTNINRHPEYDYYIRDDISTCYIKGEATTREWFEKDEYYNRSKCTTEDMEKRYSKSRFKDTMAFKEWYTKNGWVFMSETTYAVDCFDIPAEEEFEEVGKSKLFSVTVTNDNTVKAINDIRAECGDCIEYVLRSGANTEIIYRDSYREI